MLLSMQIQTYWDTSAFLSNHWSREGTLVRLAIFTAPKPFIDSHIKIIQRNAIQSWKAMGKDVEIWLVGDEEGVEKTAKELEVNFIPDVIRNESGTPRIDSIFRMVREKSQAAILCYVNSDILLFSDLLKTIDLVQESEKNFLLVGRRWDAEIAEPLKISPGWEESFIKKTISLSKLHTGTGSDYFVFPRHLFSEIPPFAVGRAGWDNWMIYDGRCKHLAVIDASKEITVIHQNHDFRHFADGKVHRHQPETYENIELAGGHYTMYTLFDTNFELSDHKVNRTKLTVQKIIREVSIFPAIGLHCQWLAKSFYVLFNFDRVLKHAKKRKRLEDAWRLRKS
jgi:hypothetical protein